jgi:hypothetical protein
LSGKDDSLPDELARIEILRHACDSAVLHLEHEREGELEQGVTLIMRP